MAVVTTGQITIVDNNDARPLTAFISVTPTAQQIYSADSGTPFTPDWTTANTNLGMELRARVFVGTSGASVDITRDLTNKKWSYDLSTAITAGAASTTYWNESSATVGAIGYITLFDDNTNFVKMRVRANQKPGIAPLTVYFEGDYTDPVTGLVSHIIASIVLSQVRTGTNAVFIQLRQPDGNVVEPNIPGAPKSTVRVFADLIRAAGVDENNVTYKWFESPHLAANQIDGNLSGITTKYGLLDVLAVGANRAGTIGQYATGAASTSAAITTTNVPDGTYGNYKGILIHHSAVADIGVFKCEARDNDGNVYQTFFTVIDVSDPYEVRLISTGGDKLQNGVGSTDVYPLVYYGQDKVTNLTSWTFNWTFYDSSGQRGGFVNTTRTAVAGGRSIVSNTTTTFSHDGAAITFAAGDIIKAVLGSTSHLFEVASATSTTITVRSPSTNAWIAASNFSTLTANKFQNGKLFVIDGSRTTNGANANDTAPKITLGGDDIDVKGTVVCEVNQP
jgi:hypothetical protein